MNKKIYIVWPAQAVITESLFRHYSMLAEVSGFLSYNSKIVKHLNYEVVIEDCAVVTHTAMNMAKIVHDSSIIAIAINMNNVKEAIDTAKFFKSVNKNRSVIAYGEAIACGADFFVTQKVFDYVIDSGQFEIGLEIAIATIENVNENIIKSNYKNLNYKIENSIIKIDSRFLLPEDMWGMPQLDLIPTNEYLRIGNGEMHITACKGCPFNCEFCNEKYVSSSRLRYRDISQIISFLCEIAPSNGAKSVYLDSSTFTYDKNWVKNLCNKLISIGKEITPWKTCTRLDCIDDELITLMGQANCKRISVGIESFSQEIQNRNNKIIEVEKLREFSESCKKNKIIPRALLIIGLNGQESEDIQNSYSFLTKLGIQTRFRVLQDFTFLINKEKLSASDFDTLNRWIVNSPFSDIDINEIRKYEYPEARNNQYYS